MKNLPLLILDLICLPITLVRLFLIYLFGACYNVPSLQFLDIMMHAKDRFFNQGGDGGANTIATDVRVSINRASRVNSELLYDYSVPAPAVAPVAPAPIEKQSIFGPKLGGPRSKQIILHSDQNLDETDIKQLQKMLPMILDQLAAKNEVDLSKIDEHIRKELDFLTFEDDNGKLPTEPFAVEINSEQANFPSSRSGDSDIDLHTDDSKIF
ncbi:MAG: hypothetical protein Hyperionvirus8_66 [Hyperionvirus sp.]|uniref:Uncharacterized protein n=1 Tax=Hyperionvirus sp. TaxID=2487770 RepID=A0A3G5A922_9VIRU|nr:MAG: hypothetical protein Hyperionvirus8_66 [Hyperionvirus sp.]